MIAIAAIALFTVAVPLASSLYGVHVALAFGLCAVQCGSLVLAPVRPAIGIGLFTAATLCLRLFVPENDAPWPWAVTSMIAFALLVALVTFYRSWVLGLWGYLVPLAVVSAQAPPADRFDAAMVNVIVAVSVVGAVYVLAVLVAQRRRIAEQLLHEREVSAAEQSRRLLVEERQRVARELHDVVAHSMSLIQVQATTARYRLPGLPPDAAAEFDDIGASARRAMTEMRRLLGVLRNGEDDVELAPQQGIADIEGLVESATRAGVQIEFSAGSLPGDIPAAVDIAGFRIAQEAISNAVRHAPGCTITVSVRSSTDAVDLVIENTPGDTQPGPAARGSGHGLVGMRERASLIGGQVHAGPTAGGGYGVRATLPLRSDTIEDSP